jgi:TadE-like protein
MTFLLRPEQGGESGAMKMRFDIWKRKGKKKTLGQSLVEFAILLPLVLLMLSGLIEFGIMLNYYLDVIDAAREAARFAADADPIRDSAGNYIDPNPQFYTLVQTLAMQSLKAGSDNRIDWLPPHNCATRHGDIVISAFGVMQNGGSPIVSGRFPSGSPLGLSLCGHYTSKFTTAQIQAKLDPAAPTTGLVLVEIFYDYQQTLALPWITAFVPNPIHLHAYSIMPNANVEPTPTP